jgi:succinyl-CoA synthetase alpha subunit
MTRVYPFVKEKGARCSAQLPGLITPGEIKVGIIPGPHLHAGHIGVVSRSGTLTYEVVYQLTRAAWAEHVRRHRRRPINGTNFIDCLAAFEKDPETKAVAMMGEIGGNRRAGGRALREGAHDEAGRSVSSRTDGTARAAGWAMRVRSSPDRPAQRREDPGVRGRGHGVASPADRLRGAHPSRL